MRVGIGYDAHKLVEGRELILGGVNVPHTKGLLGHSDADVLVHAIIDSLLGAGSWGDIGKMFPDTDAEFEGASSLILLEKVFALINENNYKIVNIDSVIVAQEPKLGEFTQKMIENISVILKTKVADVSVKATSTEWLGFVGRAEGMAAWAVCALDFA